MTTPLEHRLHQLSIDFARHVAGIISELSVEELLALTAGQERPEATPARKKRTAPTKKARRRAVARPKTDEAAASIPSAVSMASIESSPQPPPARAVPPPEDRAAVFLRAERERLESAVLKFVEQNPETDAEIVAVRVGLPKGRTQDLLDDLVLRGKLRMKSGQHGRCYLAV